jgi:hypothetical protein
MNRVHDRRARTRPRAATFVIATNERRTKPYSFRKAKAAIRRPRGSRNKTTVLMQNLLAGRGLLSL